MDESRWSGTRHQTALTLDLERGLSRDLDRIWGLTLVTPHFAYIQDSWG